MRKRLIKIFSMVFISCMLFSTNAFAGTWLQHQGNEGWVNGVYYGGWNYLNDDGTCANGWKYINNNWYYFDESDGCAYTGINTINGKDYYFDSINCDMKHDQYVRIGNGRHAAMAWACSDGHIDYNNTTFQDYIK
ncbi:hypothetical protein [Clostridium botulinum]|uniref:hypothetical protein n=1 Tax=Clostridium botulinum TaxID=1491 RepID=UPI001967E920|nr:hypothetical protein [Clostridium botulinum]MBN1079284.1 hypothetical protein [Clostridium botulinum]